MTAALGSGSAPLPPCHSHGAGRPAWSWAAPPAASKPPASPPVALPRLRICAPTRLQVPDGKLFAIKCLNRSRIVMATQSGRLAKEIRLLKLLNHPNVIRLCDVQLVPAMCLLAHVRVQYFPPCVKHGADKRIPWPRRMTGSNASSAISGR